MKQSDQIADSVNIVLQLYSYSMCRECAYSMVPYFQFV